MAWTAHTSLVSRRLRASEAGSAGHRSREGVKQALEGGGGPGLLQVKGSWSSAEIEAPLLLRTGLRPMPPPSYLSSKDRSRMEAYQVTYPRSVTSKIRTSPEQNDNVQEASLL